MATSSTEAKGVPANSRETGSAIVEFTLVMTLLLTLFLALMQLTFALHVRNTVLTAASEGARFGANANRSAEDGARRSRERIRDALDNRFAGDVTAGYEEVRGQLTVYVQVRTTLPLIGFFGPSRSLTVRGRALEEGGP
jgi:Flp pilus assembly protein TadG